MNSNLDRFKKDLGKLKVLGTTILLDLKFRYQKERSIFDKKHEDLANKCSGKFQLKYQAWYSEAHAVIKQLMPDRLAEFVELYKGNGKRKQIDYTTFTIQDLLNGVGSAVRFGEKVFDDTGRALMQLSMQIDIFEAVESRFESSLYDIAQMVRADLFDSELDAARELVKNGFLRGAGAIAGVVIEKHLAQVCANHNITVPKKDPTISVFNNLLKSAQVLDTPNWRHVERLGDIRNLCDHNKHRDPIKDEVNELIDGTEKLCKTLF